MSSSTAERPRVRAEPDACGPGQQDGVEPPTTLLQRVVMPRIADPMAVRALYVDEQTYQARRVWPPATGRRRNPREVHLDVTFSNPNARRVRPLSRTSVRVPEQTEVSFASYFNGFPAGYWRRWSILTAVHLRLTLDGAGRLDVYRSKADATQVHVHGEIVDGTQEVDVELDLTPFEDGGWYWFDLTTEDCTLTLRSGGWYAAEVAPGRAAVTIGMPTFNRPTDCVATLAAIGADPLVRSVVTAVHGPFSSVVWPVWSPDTYLVEYRVTVMDVSVYVGQIRTPYGVLLRMRTSGLGYEIVDSRPYGYREM